MEDVKIKAFEQMIVDVCNKTPICNRVKYYVLKEIADKLLEASERDAMVMTALSEHQVKENEQQKTEEQKGGGE